MRQGGTISKIKRLRKIYGRKFEIFRSFSSTYFLKIAVINNQVVCSSFFAIDMFYKLQRVIFFKYI